MTSEEKKYSLISVDTGAAEEEAGVRTERAVVNGEETIVVSSGVSRSERAERAATSDRSQHSSAERVYAGSRSDSLNESDQLVQDNDRDDDDQIPFQRMQGVIIVCLLVLIVAFLVYFNFIR